MRVTHMMEASEKPKSGRPESPTTAREPDWDDDDAASSSPKPSRTGGSEPMTTGNNSTSSRNKSQPPATLNPREQAEATLREAFPSIDAAVVKAVLVASGGQVEPAFNALLSMSDPNAKVESTLPPPPPRPAPQIDLTPEQIQMLKDEQYARQLAEHYNNQEGYGQDRRGPRPQDGTPKLPRRPNQQSHNDDLYDDRERSFIDDDLPVIRDNIKKGFIETQNKALSFINTLRKQFDGEDSEEERPPPPPPRKGQNQTAYPRRSGDRDRYDADPQVLGDDFTKLHMNDETTQRTSIRPQANPDLFKPTPTSNSSRKVSFQDERGDDDLYRASPDSTKRQNSTGSRNKWQPMAAVDPDPVQEHDPFSLGDSEDEDSKKKDLKSEDSERLKKATAEAMAEDLGISSKQTLKPVAATGTKDTEVVDGVTGKS